MKTLIYLFNGCGWGDHFLALPYLNRQIKDNGAENVMIITYQNHIDNLFNNLSCKFIGLEMSHFCFEKIRAKIDEFSPKKIVSFNAFHPFDFDFYAIRVFKECEFYGKFNEIGMTIRYPFKKYIHIRDQYFLISNNKIKYARNDRKFHFSYYENKLFQNYFTKKIGNIDFKRTVILHLDSEKRKCWSQTKNKKLIKLLLDSGIKVIIIGVEIQNLSIVSVNIKNLFVLNENKIRSVFWLVSKCKYFIGVDSVFAHVADAYNINSVILFSDYLSHEWYHNSRNVSTIYPDVGMKTKDISFEEVLFEIKQKFKFCL